MITLKRAILSEKAYQEEYLSKCEEDLNAYYSTEHDIACHINIDMDDNITMRAIYKTPKGTQVIEEKTKASEEALPKSFNKIFKKYNKQLNCEHSWKRPTTDRGEEIPDGRAICEKCSMSSEKELEPLKNKTLVKMSGSRPYVAKYDWGDTYIQGGDTGLVLNGAKTYETAFIEVFPTIDGYSTFIRGEGSTPREAEEAAKLKIDKITNCANHEFTREFRGKERTDGTGICKHCNLWSSNALPPKTLCFKCNKPTKKEFYDKHICLNDYYNLDIKEVVKEAEESHKKMCELYKSTLFDDDESIYKIKWEKEWEFRFVNELKKIMTIKEIEDNYSSIENIFNHINFVMANNLYTKGNRISSKSNCPENESVEVIDNMLSCWRANADKIKDYFLNNKKTIKNEIIIYKDYLKKAI